jgi:putative ABC transport system substrate-binding protein
MVGKLRKLVVFIVVITLIGVVSGCSKDHGKIRIGITQFVSHPALDSVHDGFIDGLASKGYKENENIEFVTSNAQADVSTANLIASDFMTKKLDLILAIATPSAQAMKNVSEGSKVPVLFSAVTDPENAGLVPSENMTGTSDKTPIDKQFDLLKTIFPDKNKVGIIYNTGETNSLVQVQSARVEAKKQGIQLIEKGITSTTEIASALDVLLNEVDVLYIPTDNLVASSMSLIVSKAMDKHIPIVGSEKGQVEAGALITDGINYYELGFQTGLMAASILDGKKVSDIPVETLKNTELVVNKQTQESLHIKIPQTILDRAISIEGGE